MKTIRIGLVPVHAMSLSELLAAFDRIIEEGSPSYACFYEANLCVQATRNPRVRRALEAARFVLPDGTATTWGARLLGQHFPERLSGPHIMLQLCQHGLEKGYAHFFYGGAKGVADALAARLLQSFPGLKVAGTHSPPFRTLTPQEDEEVVARINKCRPDIVWVGLGAPKQEMWVHEHLGRVAAPLMLPVGAAFDFHSGNKKWAPLWIRRMGFEWVYRMFTGGRRVFIRNTRSASLFTALIVRQAFLKLVGASRDFREEAG